jgi:hypothetical protein
MVDTAKLFAQPPAEPVMVLLVKRLHGLVLGKVNGEHGVNLRLLMIMNLIFVIGETFGKGCRRQ